MKPLKLRRLRALPGRLRPLLTAFAVMGAALFFAAVAVANRGDAGAVFVTGFFAGCFASAAFAMAVSALTQEAKQR